MSTSFGVGQRVRIARRDPLVHNRVPRYARGATGVVERVCGFYGEPERLAYGDRSAPRRRLYRVRLWQRDLWPDYGGDGRDTLEIEVFEHWLERLESR